MMILPHSVNQNAPYGRNIVQVHPDAAAAVNAENENWFIATLNENEEEEVYWKGNTVVITSYDVEGKKNFLKKCHTVDSLIQDVLYADFYLHENSATEACKCLCVLEKEFLNVFTNDGELFVAALPFKVRKIWAVYNGVCLEREPSSMEMDESRKGMPTLFSLTHPLEDVKPIVYRRQDCRKPNYFTDTQTNVVYTYPGECLIMTYDSVIGVHSIWKARKATEQDFPETSIFMERLPEFCYFSAHSSHLANPKDMSRMSLSPMRNKRHSCPPIPFHGKTRPTMTTNTTTTATTTMLNSSKGGSQSSTVFSPITKDFVQRNTPQPLDIGPSRVFNEWSQSSVMQDLQGNKKLSSSLLSSCDDSSMEDEMEPLPPDVCLEQVWQETGDLIRYGHKGQAEKGFMTRDFFGNSYLGYMIRDLGKLRLLMMREGDKGLGFEKVMEMDCHDVGSFQHSDMFLVLDKTFTMQLFTGNQKVCTPEMVHGVDLSTCRLWFGGRNLTFADIRSSSGSSDGPYHSLQVPSLCDSHLVMSCIDYLKQMFTWDEFNLIHSKYYVLFNNRTNSRLPHTSCDWSRFVDATFKLLGFIESSSDETIKESVSTPSPPHAKRPKKNDSLAGAEDWEYLLSCDPHNRNYNTITSTTTTTTTEPLEMVDSMSWLYESEMVVDTSAPMHNSLTDIFLAWHQLYEELKLNIQQQPHLLNFARLLHFLAKLLRSSVYVQLYETDHPDLKKTSDASFKLDDQVFYSADEEEDGMKTNEQKACSFYTSACECLQGLQTLPLPKERNIFSSVLSQIFSLIFHRASKPDGEDFEQLLSDLDLERKDSLVENIIDCMMGKGFTKEELELLPIGYKLPIKELLHHYITVNDVTVSVDIAAFLGRNDIVALQKEKAFNVERDNTLGKEENEDKNGMSFNPEIFNLRFNQDLRVNEVKRLLNSSVPIDITLVQKPDVNDHAFAKEEEAKLLLISNRTMSLPVARGMLTLGTSEAVKSEVVSTPELDLSGRSTTNNKTIILSQSETPNPRILWPSFHNGVAAGLKIAMGASDIDATWILLNKLKYADLTADHAGFLLALGLSGHLSTLPKLQLHDYLVKGYELTTVALLLGVAAAQIGSKNADAHVMSSVHLDSLLPQTALELSIPQSSQVAAIISIGLLFFNSIDSHLVKVLLFEIGRMPGPDLENSSDRESHALAAGFALGMMMIGQGKGSVHVADINVESMLYHYVYGGQRKDNILSIHDKLQSPSCQIQEGDLVNTDVTSPAAIMALSLIYLRTNISVVADWLNVPVSDNMTDILKPEHALLRTLAYNLIMWDSLAPTQSWLESFVPNHESVIADAAHCMHSHDIHYIFSIVTGCFFALGIKFAGSCNQTAFNLMFPWIKVIEGVMGSPLADELGAKVVLEQCFDAVLLSVSLVVAGSGNIKVLRIARRAHKRCSTDVSYGNHMAVHMAIGFLFLGGGRYTLKTDDLAVAALLCSLYPKWPVSSKDNRFHLQALRHLYVLACEPRLFITRDVDTKQICYSPLEVTLRGSDWYPESSLKMLSPCFIPELKYIKEIKVVGPRYWPIAFSLDKRSITLEHIKNVVVKKKAGYLSYSEDPKGKRNLLGSTFTNQSDKLQLIKSFNSSSYVTLCAENISSNVEETRRTREKGRKDKGDFFSNILYECVTNEKLDIYEDYVVMEKVLFNAEHGVFDIYGIQQLSFLYLYYTQIHPILVRIGVVAKKPLVNQLYTLQTKLRLENAIDAVKSKHTGMDGTVPFGMVAADKIIRQFNGSLPHALGHIVK